MLPEKNKSAGVLFIIGMMCILLGSRLALIEKAGYTIPFLDQWDAEAREVITPWLHGELTISDLLRPHNEHRILFTRIIALFSTSINGQWDPFPTLVINSIIYCLLFCTIWKLASFNTTRAESLALGLILLGIGLSPLGWENTIWAFQNQVYLTLLFGYLCTGILAHDCNTSYKKLYMAFTCAIASAFAMSAGFLLTGAFATKFTIALKSSHTKRYWAWLVATLIMGLCAILLRTYYPAHAPLQSQSYPIFAAALTKLLAWPLTPGWLWFIPMQIPLGLLSWQIATQKRTPRNIGKLALLLGAWGLANSAALAYGRGNMWYATAEDIPSRYADMQFILIIANILAGIEIQNFARCTAQRLIALGAIGLAIIAIGIASIQAIETLAPLTKEAQYASSFTISEAVRTQQTDKILQSPARLLPHPRPQVIHQIISDPKWTQFLPPQLQPPLICDWPQNQIPIPDGFPRPDAGPFWVIVPALNTAARMPAVSQTFSSQTSAVALSIYTERQTAGSILIETKDGEQVWAAEFSALPTGAWSTQNILTGHRECRIRVNAEGTNGLVIISAPRPIGPCSYWSHWLAKQYKIILCMGGIIFSISFFQRKNEPT